MKKSLGVFLRWLFFCLFYVFTIQAQVKSSFYDSGREKSTKGDYQGAIKDFDRVIEQYPNESKPYYYRGVNKFNLKNYSSAFDDFNIAIGFNPKFGDAYYMRGMAKIGMKKRKEACIDFQIANELGNPLASSAIEKYCK